ncbi:MAG: helix-turn-helix domain-containing protein [Treponema sp.]|nr:helix-turn-helix domain-containing protein [Treponema sp.]
MDALDRIRLVRKALGLNQGDFARRIGLTQNTVSMIELGKIALTDKNVKLICATFAVNEEWLRRGSGEMLGPASPYEKELVAVFGRLSSDTQEFVLEMAQNLLRRQERRLPDGAGTPDGPDSGR